MHKNSLTLVRDLSVFDGLALVVGTVIGSGIFLVSAAMAQELPNLYVVLVVWVFGGVLSIFGALSLSELSSRYPEAGGLYVFLREAYGRPIAFMYGWSLLTVIQSGTIATLAVGFSIYFCQIFTIATGVKRCIPMILILGISMMNFFGLRLGKIIQNASTFAKVAGMALLVALLFWKGHLPASSFVSQNSTPVSLFSLGLATVAVLWAYEGWHTVSFASSEFHNPQRDVPRSLFLGTSICMVIYIVMTLGYYAVLSPQAIASSDHVASSAARVAYGSGAGLLISLLVMVSIFGSTNGMILTGPRVYYAMAKDGLFFSQMKTVHPKYRTPAVAIAVQAVWASGITFIGSFQQLFTYVIFSAWIFYGLTVFGLIRVRGKQSVPPGCFRTPWYPCIPLAFTLAALYIVLNTFAANTMHAFIGVGVILLGLPVFLLFRFYEKASLSKASVS